MPATTSDPLRSPNPTFHAPLPAIATPPSQWHNPDQESPGDPPEWNGDQLGESAPTSTSTDFARVGGDPEKVAKVLGGLLVIVITTVSLLARRRGRDVRSPTPRQRDDIARPLARIACRHIPLDALGPDLVDFTEAAVATHEYVLDGPLVTTVPEREELDVPTFDTPE